MNKLAVLLFSMLFGGVAYGHVTDNMQYSHETGIAIGLLVAIVSAAIMAFYMMENDDVLRQADLHRHKRGKR